MRVSIASSAEEMGCRAAAEAAQHLRAALAARGEAAIVVATGTSQFATLKALVEAPDIDWSRVTGFHLDEYLALPITHLDVNSAELLDPGVVADHSS